MAPSVFDWFHWLVGGRAQAQRANPALPSPVEMPTPEEFRELRYLKRQVEALKNKQLADAKKIRQQHLSLCGQRDDATAREIELAKLRRHAQELQKGRLGDTEKIRRQQQLLSQAQEEVTRKEKLHHEELNNIYSKLNLLQIGGNTRSDEQIAEELRRLSQNLENWISANFKDAAKLASCIESGDEFPHTFRQRRACIQAHIAALVLDWIFIPYQTGVPEQTFGATLKYMETNVQQHCSEALLNNWKVATSTTIEAVAKEYREAVFTDIINLAEEQFGPGSSTLPQLRTQQLRKFLQRCSDFKNTLNRQRDTYYFCNSPFGAEFSPESMTFVGGDGEHVGLSLWPGLAKLCPTGGGSDSLLEAELVWTVN